MNWVAPHLAEVARAPASVLKQLRDRRHGGLEEVRLPLRCIGAPVDVESRVDPEARRRAARHEAGPARAADGAGGVEVGEDDSVLRYPVQIRPAWDGAVSGRVGGGVVGLTCAAWCPRRGR